MGSIRAGNVMENVWLVFLCRLSQATARGARMCQGTFFLRSKAKNASIDYKNAQIFSTASRGSPIFGISYFAYFLYNPRRVR